MSFIGNVPAEAYSPVAKDTFSGDDSTTDFTLSIPATTNGVEVLVENVQQEPTTAYTISGTTLSFTAAPVTGTNNIYVIHRGPAVQTIVPPAGVAIDASTVDATGDISTEGDLKVEVTSGGIYTITGTDTATNRTLTLPDEAGTVLTSASDITSSQLPANGFFHATMNGNQSINDTTFTKVEFDTESVDSEGWYDTSNYRYTPQVAGWYRFDCKLVVGDSSITRGIGDISKNGSSIGTNRFFDIVTNGSGAFQLHGTMFFHLNGSTDYVEAYAWIDNTGSDQNVSSADGTYFSGQLVRAD